jgi:hypothetical protein
MVQRNPGAFFPSKGNDPTFVRIDRQSDLIAPVYTFKRAPLHSTVAAPLSVRMHMCTPAAFRYNLVT